MGIQAHTQRSYPFRVLIRSLLVKMTAQEYHQSAGMETLGPRNGYINQIVFIWFLIDAENLCSAAKALWLEQG